MDMVESFNTADDSVYYVRKENEIIGDIKDQDTDRSKEKDTGSGQKERFSHFL